MPAAALSDGGVPAPPSAATRRAASSTAPALLTVLFALTACSSRSAPLPAPAPAPGDDGLADVPESEVVTVDTGDPLPGVRVPLGTLRDAAVGLPGDARDLYLTVYPTPREAAYEETAVRLADAVVVTERDGESAGLLERLGLTDDARDLPASGYLLSVGVHDGVGSVLTWARDAAGRRQADRALGQLTAVDGDGERRVRECLVVDAPAMRFRGSKRPQAWELRYGANFSWGTPPGAAGREVAVPFHAPGGELDAGEAGVARALEAFEGLPPGGRAAVKFDDVGFGLTPESRLRFGSYPRAIVAFVHGVRDALAVRDPEATLYYLPQTYWWNDDRLPSFARAVRFAGGLPDDVGLVMTGPEIVSESIDALGLAEARAAFGLTETKALVYDNRGREGDWGPLAGRDAALVDHADAVFGERGTPVNRLTRLDWEWNPNGFDAERSWRRALLELAGPAGYRALRDACAAFREEASRDRVRVAVEDLTSLPRLADDGPVPRPELMRLLRADVERVAAEPTRAGAAVR